MHLHEWWAAEGFYYILPNRLYWLLGANYTDSLGEWEWYTLRHGLCRNDRGPSFFTRLSAQEHGQEDTPPVSISLRMEDG